MASEAKGRTFDSCRARHFPSCRFTAAPWQYRAGQPLTCPAPRNASGMHGVESVFLDTDSPMPDLTPAQRTSTTARYILAAGLLLAAPAILNVSVTATLLAWLLMLVGVAMWVAARRAD